MTSVRMLLSDILIAWAITIIVVVLVLTIPLAVWLTPDQGDI